MDTGELFDYNLKSPPTFNPFEGRSNGNSDKVILLPYPSYNPSRHSILSVNPTLTFIGRQRPTHF
jgi:hypothetical protein